MARRAASSERIVTGVKAIDRKLAKLGKASTANKIARAGLMKGARLAAKTIKKSIPSRLKSVRAAIGHSVKKAKKGPTKGITIAKAGAAVGKKKNAQSKAKRSTKYGKGISVRNVRWWLMGTAERRQKKPFANPKGSNRIQQPGPTGRMPANPVVKNLNLRPILAATMEGSEKALKRELDKIAKSK